MAAVAITRDDHGPSELRMLAARDSRAAVGVATRLDGNRSIEEDIASNSRFFHA